MRRVFQARARRLFLFCAASACCFAITACGEDDGPVAGPIAGEMAADLNGDSIIDLADVGVFIDNYLEGCGF